MLDVGPDALGAVGIDGLDIILIDTFGKCLHGVAGVGDAADGAPGGISLLDDVPQRGRTEQQVAVIHIYMVDIETLADSRHGKLHFVGGAATQDYSIGGRRVGNGNRLAHIAARNDY